MAVNFFIVGAAKSGTTSIANYLNQHPDVFIPSVKEPKYFTVKDNIFPHNGPGDNIIDELVVRDLAEYNALYLGKDDVTCGDASVDYLFYKNAAKRIVNYNENSKIIIILRNPVDRAYSAYLHLFRDGRETLSFEEALSVEEKRFGRNWEFFWRYFECGLYSSQVKRYLDLFPLHNIKIILFDDFVSNELSLIRDLYQFIGVDSIFVPDVSKKLNESGIPNNRWVYSLMNKKNPIKELVKTFLPKKIRSRIKSKIDKDNLNKIPMDTRIREILIEKYRSDIIDLEEMTGCDLHLWLDDHGRVII